MTQDESDSENNCWKHVMKIIHTRIHRLSTWIKPGLVPEVLED